VLNRVESSDQRDEPMDGPESAEDFRNLLEAAAKPVTSTRAAAIAKVNGDFVRHQC
jgi:hypothetical protein